MEQDEAYQKLKNAGSVMEVLAAAKPEAQKVEQAIGAIGTVLPGSAETIAAVRTAYNSLPEQAKAMVSNETELKAAEEAAAALQKGIEDTAALLRSLPDPDQIGLDRSVERTVAIRAARKALTALTKEQQAAIPSELSEKLARLEELDSKIGSAANAARWNRHQSFRRKRMAQYRRFRPSVRSW